MFLNKEKYVIKKYQNRKIKHLDTDLIDKKISNTKALSLNFPKRDEELIINVTSFPQRIKDIHYTLYSLLMQTLAPDRVILWLGHEEFPNELNDLPNEIINLAKKGLEINFCHNLGSYNKLIDGLRQYPSAVHVTADDDVYYHEDWLKGLYSEYKKFGKKYVYAYRVRKIVLDSDKISPYNTWKIRKNRDYSPYYLNFFTGVGGVLYPSKILGNEVFNEEKFLSLTPHADDIWYWAMAVMNSAKIKMVPKFRGLVYTNPARELGLSGDFTLNSVNVKEDKNDIQIQNILNTYPIFDKLKEEWKIQQKNRSKLSKIVSLFRH